MHIVNHPELLRKEIGQRRVSLVLGNFDGVHMGHRTLISKVRDKAKINDELVVVVTFSPHPMQFFAKNHQFKKINTKRIQHLQMAALGIDAIVELNFDTFLASQSGDDFVENYLECLPVSEISVGQDFRFGKNRQGDVNLLRSHGVRRNFTVNIIEPVCSDGLVVSSTQIRELISELGAMDRVCKLLNRPFALDGKVIYGDQLGRKIGFPTANIGDIEQVVPRNGVYFGELKRLSQNLSPAILGKSYPCVINIGHRPTVQQNQLDLRVEAHVFDAQDQNFDIYNERVELKFLTRLRDEKKFSSVDELKKQIAQDIACAKSLMTP